MVPAIPATPACWSATCWLDTQPTPRAGYIKTGAAELEHAQPTPRCGVGRCITVCMVSSGDTWAAGAIAVADNADGLHVSGAYDVRGEFPRFWDDGRGVDSGRAFGSWQRGSPASVHDDNNGAGCVESRVGLTSVSTDGATGLADVVGWSAVPEAYYTQTRRQIVNCRLW